MVKSAVATVPAAVITYAKTLRAIGEEIQGLVIEREQLIELSLMALIARQNVIIFGVPGTGKSLLINRIAEHVVDADYFSVLLMRDMATDAVFGPPDLKQLKLGEYGRNYKNYLPTAHIAFCDEIGKAPTGILNSLLTVMNEKHFTDKGKLVKVPLMTLFGASNELIGAKELDAIRDRFQVRYEVKPLSDSGMAQLLANDDEMPAPVTTITRVELEDLQMLAKSVTIPAVILESLVKLRADLRSQGFEPSDRRFNECKKLLRASAIYNGRTSVIQDDLDVLAHIMWEKPESRSTIASAVSKVGNPLKAKATEILDEATVAFNQTDGMPVDDFSALQLAIIETRSKLKKAKEDLETLRSANPGSNHEPIDRAIEKLVGFNKKLKKKNDADLD